MRVCVSARLCVWVRTRFYVSACVRTASWLCPVCVCLLFPYTLRLCTTDPGGRVGGVCVRACVNYGRHNNPLPALLNRGAAHTVVTVGEKNADKLSKTGQVRAGALHLQR